MTIEELKSRLTALLTKFNNANEGAIKRIEIKNVFVVENLTDEKAFVYEFEFIIK